MRIEVGRTAARTICLSSGPGSLASVNPLGQRASQVYDAAGRVKASVDPLGNRTSTVYDAVGRRAASVDPLRALRTE